MKHNKSDNNAIHWGRDKVQELSITAYSIVAPALSAEISSNQEQETKTNPNKVEIRSSQEIDKRLGECGILC
jgi:hypothetical protein